MGFGRIKREAHVIRDAIRMKDTEDSDIKMCNISWCVDECHQR
jgi:hypothetical protein